jgi:catechol 2,3-dioxygenase-like lactoylglutathione lyase family enzyme
MEQLIEKLVQDFEAGRTTRRQLVQTLAMAAAVGSAGARVGLGQEAAPLKAIAINHISYQVADYAKTRDFYSTLFGMKVSEDNGKQCNLTLGNINIVARNGTGATPTVDHIAYSIDNWNKDAVLAELKRRQLDPKPEGPNSFQIKDPDGYHVQLSPTR